jgi:hypothetical protein
MRPERDADWTEAAFVTFVIACLAGAALWLLWLLAGAWIELNFTR